jgi:uncharacterized protein
MELLSDHGRRIALEDLNTTKLLAHASRQARQRKYDDMVIVDVDSHHYENESMREIVPFMENDILKQLVTNAAGRGRLNMFPNHSGFTDMGGRVTRYPLRPSEKTDSNGKHREVQLGHRWMDAMGVDYTCLFPTGMLAMGQTPQKEIEREATWAYSRWLTEKVIPESGGRLCSALPLPFSSPNACLRHVEKFGDRKGVVGFMVTTVRDQPVYDDAYMSTYRAIEERGLTLSFHAGNNWGEAVFKSCNRFLTVHALGFSFYNMLHLSNWVVNGMGERLPKLPVIWIESGLAWLPFLIQRLDHEFMMRPSEAPLRKKKPSDYMRDMYYSSQPMERNDLTLLEQTFRVIDAENHLLYASDYPHWDFDLPSTIYDLPFVSEKGRHNILGGTAARLFKLPPRNDRQRENLIKYGNLAA